MLFQKIFLFIFLINYTIGNAKENCPLVPNLIPIKYTTDDFRLYFYTSIYAVTFDTNSIDVINQNGELMECISINQFKHDNNLNIDIEAFGTILYINENLYAIAFVEEKTSEMFVANNFSWLFTDTNLNMRHDLGIIKMGPHIDSKIFKDDSYIDIHDIYVNEEITHAVFIVKQFLFITDVREYFPEAIFDSFGLTSQGLCSIDLKTGKEVAAVSGDGLFIELDEWYNYIYYHVKDYFMPNSEIIENRKEYRLDFVHINSMRNIDGSHFSSKLNKKLFLIYEKVSSIAYLFDWDYKKSQNDKIEMIWELPSLASPEVKRREWMDRWEYIGDPFYGTSSAHHANIRNLPKGHILLYDNGLVNFIKKGSTKDKVCPISRIVEYKIEMDYEREGQHRIELVFSYPKVSEYVDLVVDDKDIEFDDYECIEIWDKYNYQSIVGNVDKIAEDKYMTSYYSYYTMLQLELGRNYSHKMLIVDCDGEIVSGWESHDSTISYKISPIDLNSFRNGIYQNKLENYQF